jgi:hypothetical protein
MMTVGLACWRNDEARDLEARAAHLLAKRAVDAWVWVVGDSTDATETMLEAIGAPGVTLLRHDTGLSAESGRERLVRFSAHADWGLAAIPEWADRVLIHESDLVSPVDVAARLAGGRTEAVAGWPILRLGGVDVFYDTWAYRSDGQRFDATMPYHPRYRANARFSVDSVGSCWTLPAWAVRHGARCGGWGAVGLCRALRDCGVSVWVEPAVTIVQPTDRWVLQELPG